MYSCVQYYSKVNTHIYQSTHVGIKIAFTFYWPLTLFWVVWRRKATGLCSLLNHTSHRSYNVIPAPGEPGPTEPLKILKWSFPPSTLLEITGGFIITLWSWCSVWFIVVVHICCLYEHLYKMRWQADRGRCCWSVPSNKLVPATGLFAIANAFAMTLASGIDIERLKE